jgi:hypothetical protein
MAYARRRRTRVLAARALRSGVTRIANAPRTASQNARETDQSGSERSQARTSRVQPEHTFGVGGGFVPEPHALPLSVSSLLLRDRDHALPCSRIHSRNVPGVRSASRDSDLVDCPRRLGPQGERRPRSLIASVSDTPMQPSGSAATRTCDPMSDVRSVQDRRGGGSVR